MLKKLITLTCGVVLLSGCAKVQFGHSFDLNQFVAQVERGTTTEAQVREWLGEPTSQGFIINTEGEKLKRWVYYYGSGKLFKLHDATMRTLEVQFDNNGVVKAYDWLNNQ